MGKDKKYYVYIHQCIIIMSKVKITIKKERSTPFDFSKLDDEKNEEKELGNDFSRFEDVKWDLSRRILLIGASGSGKSNTIRSILRSMLRSDGDRIAGIWWFGGSQEEEKEWLEKDRRFDTLSDARIQAMIKMQKNPAMKNLYQILILDDVSGIKSHNNKVMDHLFSVASRHQKICVISSVQRHTMLSPCVRDNSDVIIATNPNNELASILHKQSREEDFYSFRKKLMSVIPKQRIWLMDKNNAKSFCYNVKLCENPY